MTPPLRLAFLRPRFGIGGAERLILDAILELQRRGHAVTVHMPELPDRPQFADFPTWLPVVRAGAAFPESVSGRLRLPCALARTGWAARALAKVSPPYDAVVCDTIPHVIPALKRRTATPVVYYGHFPDVRLTGPRTGVYSWYRGPLDRLEARGLAAADRIVVNSRFTADVFRQTFPSLRDRTLEVIYPGVERSSVSSPPIASLDVDANRLVLLVPGRLDPRKNLALAIEATASLRDRVPGDVFARVLLVFAGRYDDRLPEIRALRESLLALAQARGVADRVRLDLSPDHARYAGWLNRCRMVVYTPEAEHFGIVPLEAMAAGKPVVASNRGGPVETIVDGETGLLRDATPAAFADAIAQLLSDPARADRLGAAGRVRVARHFSREAFGDRLESCLRALVQPDTREGTCG